MSESTRTRPNVLLVMTDQMRGDCLSLAGHSALATPVIDEIGGKGTFFQRAYTTCASCIPARRSLLTGKYPRNNGLVGFEAGHPIRSETLPGMLRDTGYRTVLVGRSMHQSPPSEPYGYDRRILGSTYIEDDEYATMLNEQVPLLGGVRGMGISFNGWQAKPWPLPGHLHPTNWTIRRSREVLAEHDPTTPLFLTSSFYAPHPPLLPPQYCFRRYLDTELPPAAIGTWEDRPMRNALGAGIDAYETVLEGDRLRYAQAGYLAMIQHLDDQLYWLLKEFRDASTQARRPWIIVFTSDHGEMLGDHYLYRKCQPYEGSSHIPLLIQTAPELGLNGGLRCGSPVCLEDIIPTVAELAEATPPKDLDGRSLVPIMNGSAQRVRDRLHCEHAPKYGENQAYHMITDGSVKYIWRPTEGGEQFFDLESDPRELHDLSDCSGYDARIDELRSALIDELRDRPEGFVRDGTLVAGRPYPAWSGTESAR